MLLSQEVVARTVERQDLMQQSFFSHNNKCRRTGATRQHMINSAEQDNPANCTLIWEWIGMNRKWGLYISWIMWHWKLE